MNNIYALTLTMSNSKSARGIAYVAARSAKEARDLWARKNTEKVVACRVCRNKFEYAGAEVL